MSAALGDAVGPWVFPPNAFAEQVAKLPVGQRPLTCVQQPGEIVAFPDYWWHATYNLDDLTLAYGQKPNSVRGRALPSDAVQQLVHNHSFSKAHALFTGTEMPVSNSNHPTCVRPHNCAWYNILGRSDQSVCEAVGLLNASLATMDRLAASAALPRARGGSRGPTTNALLAETAAFANCAVVEHMTKVLDQAQKSWSLPWSSLCLKDGSARAILQRWARSASAKLVPHACQTHCMPEPFHDRVVGAGRANPRSSATSIAKDDAALSSLKQVTARLTRHQLGSLTPRAVLTFVDDTRGCGLGCRFLRLTAALEAAASTGSTLALSQHPQWYFAGTCPLGDAHAPRNSHECWFKALASNAVLKTQPTAHHIAITDPHEESGARLSASSVWTSPSQKGSLIFTLHSYTQGFHKLHVALGRAWGIDQCMATAGALAFLLRPNANLERVLDEERTRISSPYVAMHVRHGDKWKEGGPCSRFTTTSTLRAHYME
jgi:hypothetical protein